MSETYSTLRKKIVAYMSRNETDFVTGGVDCLAQAIQNTKNFCQRTIDFEYQRAFVQVDNVSLANGGSLLNAKLFGTTTSVPIKSVEHAWLGDVSGQYPIDIITRDDYVSRKLRLARDGSMEESPVTRPTLVIVGQDFYVDQGAISIGPTFTVYFDVIKWHPEFGANLTGTASATTVGKLTNAAATFVTSGVQIGDVVFNTTDGTSTTVAAVNSETELLLLSDIFTIGEAYQIGTGVQTSFLLDFCFDYMLFRTIWELNFYLKEDQRFAISDAALDKIWKNIVIWNASIVGNTASVKLD